MAAWTKAEVLKLISIWREDGIQAQLESCRHNKDVYQKISDELSEAGFTRTFQQCREKLKKLRAQYKTVKDKRNNTGQGRYPEWDYFDAIDEVLGHRPATEPTVVIDTSTVNPATHIDIDIDAAGTASSDILKENKAQSENTTPVKIDVEEKKKKFKIGVMKESFS